MVREVTWSAWDGPGLGHLRLAVRDSCVVADGLVLGVAEGGPFRIAYEVRCDAYWRVRYCAWVSPASRRGSSCSPMGRATGLGPKDVL
jgi:hypothetical protein